jgi:replicative DNA helicase
MIVIAARPAMGKTAFMLSAARNAAVIFEKPVAIFSLEMSSSQLFKRLISAESSVSSNGMRSGKLTDSDLNQIHSRIHKLSVAPIYIDDTPSISINQLKAKSIKMKKLHGIELIIIDYLQLMSGGEFGGNREQEISSISRAIKTLAKELNVPIIALSQLSRSVETRGGDKKPMLSDLRESGAIEQDADMVCFLYRPEYYGFLNDESGESTIGKAEIIIAKHRNGSVDSAKLKYVAQFTRFENLDGETIVNTNVKNSIYPNQDLKPNNDFDTDDYNLVNELPF